MSTLSKEEMKDTQTQDLEETSNQAGLKEPAQDILAQVKTLSAEQLNLLLHETKRLIKQLGCVMTNPRAPYPQVFEQSSHMVTQVDALREALVLEHVRRQLAYLHTEISKSARSDEGAVMQAVTTWQDDVAIPTSGSDTP